MEQLRRALSLVGTYLGRITPTQKLLVGSLAIIALMSLLLVSQYASRRQLVELWPGASAEDNARAVAFLRTSNIVHEVDPSGRVRVPVGEHDTIMARLNQAGEQPANKALVFENMLENSSWLRSKEENRQLYRVMLQNKLASILSSMPGLTRAEVILDIPERVGLGAAREKPTASIVLFPRTSPIPQQTVDMAARMVAGTVVGLDISRVTVGDGVGGMALRVTDDAELLPSRHLEHTNAVERQKREKIASLLYYIAGVGVEVTASVDTTRVVSQVNSVLPEGRGTLALVKSERSTSDSVLEDGPGGEPGVRANTGTSLNTGGGRAVRSQQSTSETEFENLPGTKTEQIQDSRGNPTRFAATVTVPRPWLVAVLTAEAKAAAAGGDEPAPPTEEQIQARWASERTEIEGIVRPHLKTRTPAGEEVEGDLRVTLVALPASAMPMGSLVMPGAAPASGGGGGLGMPGIESILDKAIPALLGVIAVGFMFMLLRRSGRRAEMPTPEEIVGLPPALDSSTDIVGEADESDTPLAGIELEESQIRVAKVREQVVDLVKSNPDLAVKILSRWIAVEH